MDKEKDPMAGIMDLMKVVYLVSRSVRFELLGSSRVILKLVVDFDS